MRGQWEMSGICETEHWQCPCYYDSGYSCELGMWRPYYKDGKYDIPDDFACRHSQAFKDLHEHPEWVLEAHPLIEERSAPGRSGI